VSQRTSRRRDLPSSRAARTRRLAPGKRRRQGTDPRLVAGAVALGVVLIATAFVLAGGFGGGPPLPTPGPSAVAGACPTSQPAALPAGQTRLVTVETRLGSFTITVNGSLSPIAAGNFVALAGCGFYDGVVFHRIAALPDGTPFVIQGGDPTGTGTGGPGYTIADEPVTATYRRGTVAMARTAAPNSQGSQFFIVLDDRDGSVLASANTYAIFGEVTSGMDVVDAIYAAANGVENPADPVAMTSVSVTDPAGLSPSP
jgi:cyclophilin family peptidyl-prolyl cis-trans isomerase